MLGTKGTAVRSGDDAPTQSGRKRKRALKQGLSVSTKVANKADKSSSTLLREIEALGGSREDLDLVGGVQSGTEDELQLASSPSEATERDLQHDLADFVKELGIRGEHEGGPILDKSKLSSKGPDTRKENTEGILPKTSRKKKSIATDSVAKKDKPEYRSSDNLIFDPRPDWHAAALPSLPALRPDLPPPSEEVLAHIKQYADSLLKMDNELYSSRNATASSANRFLSTIMTSGTLSDRVSALTLAVQESPLHSMKSFESLLTLSRKRNREQALSALAAMKDLLGVGTVLPERRLKAFTSQSGLIGALQHTKGSNWRTSDPLPGTLTKVHLISFAYEDWLKNKYFDLLKILESWCSDEVEYARVRTISFVSDLLKEKPEQESNLLRLLVNKLGDTDNKIASKASFLLLQLQITHPLMKNIIISSIESEIILRSGQTAHAKYYAIITLNQTILSSKEALIADKLLDVYFCILISLLKRTSITSASHRVNNKKGRSPHPNIKFEKNRRRSKSRTNEGATVGEEVTEKMISAVLTGVNRAFPFSDNKTMLHKHLDSLFRITHSTNFNTSIQALTLLQQFTVSNQGYLDRYYRALYESLLDMRLLNSSKQAMYLNLVFKSLKSDNSIKRVHAFIKRMLQVMSLHQPAFICGVLYVVKELQETFPSLQSLLQYPEEHDANSNEAFEDVSGNKGVYIEAATTNSHLADQNGSKGDTRSRYDGRKRDPEHSGAETTCLWELLPFTDHFHPSVSLFATRVLLDETKPPKPDLFLHSLIHFLDRFVYRKAKSTRGRLAGNSIMQPLGAGQRHSTLLAAGDLRRESAPLNSEEFWKKNSEDVAADEVFFHKYFSKVGRGKHVASKQGKSTQDESNDEDEQEMWKALVNSRPEIEGGSDEDVDIDFSDMSLSDGEPDSVDAEGMEMDDLSLSEDDVSILGNSHHSEPLSDNGEDTIPEIEGSTAIHGQPAAADISTSRKGRKRRKLKNLPTFASLDDYADILREEDDL